MDSYKKYTMDKADLILQPIIGGELILLSYIGFSQESRFEFLSKIEGCNQMGDSEILSLINFGKYLASDVFIINEDSYIKDKVYMVSVNDIYDFVKGYFDANSGCFFNGDTFFISPLNKILIEFQHNGYVFLHKLPIVLNEHGRSKLSRESFCHI
ncbi:hypothetical protein HZS38_04230 [Xenorhabdus nematophila]|uniref:hypothetical protein n=2 Tax=Xenorhabdus nematophila TaxID=628 RepID=UPI000542A057|nr:hypothetical protein [Xenorhabdus nematophila]CEF32064.1 hypothetical protein XNW1_4220028 [Xenorhabdus nematophila str. Websteri]AYA39858.1 hypothetical protein D3790_04710 [Xenorhabdus nematophila]MBA0018425.1 hypothetical protein [Xenorhabdus nematophila]MCB4425495.1 hypothetical protein [Xenorhabdus nematophila]QNJ37500.1 hypothetical protein H8F46_04665 [Xenorhabdus nematophila]